MVVSGVVDDDAAPVEAGADVMDWVVTVLSVDSRLDGLLGVVAVVGS